MNKIASLLLIATLGFAACKSKKAAQTAEVKCPDKMCTMMFASVPVNFVDQSGQPASVKNYKAVNLRTKEDITHADNRNISGSTFTVADDSDLKKLSEAGDDILITGINTASNKTITDTVKVSGGVCACHVARVAGPAEVKVN